MSLWFLKNLALYLVVHYLDQIKDLIFYLNVFKRYCFLNLSVLLTRVGPAISSAPLFHSPHLVLLAHHPFLLTSLLLFSLPLH